MSSIRAVLAAGGTALALTVASGANAGLINGGFETGDFTGWTLSSGGAHNVVGAHGSYGPKEGNSFALLESAAMDVLTSVWQHYYLDAGQSLGGWAFFDTTDYLPYNDYAKVEIYGSSGLVATPFFTNVGSVGDYGDGPWTYWSFMAPSDGFYTVVMGVANSGDGSVVSYGGFDNVVGVEQIPEPGTLTLFGLGLAGLGLARRRKS